MPLFDKASYAFVEEGYTPWRINSVDLMFDEYVCRQKHRNTMKKQQQICLNLEIYRVSQEKCGAFGEL